MMKWVESERARRSRLQFRFSCAITLMIAAALFSVATHLTVTELRRWLVDDFSKRTPEFSYQRLFRHRMPEDVRNFQAFGHSSLGGADAGATFQATPATIHILNAAMKPVPAAKIAAAWSDTMASPQRFTGFNVKIEPRLNGTWLAWTTEYAGSFSYLFWNPQQREARYYYWSQ